MNQPAPNLFDQIPGLHELYCRMTGQHLPVERYDRQRQWYELLRAGFTAPEVERVIRYLQREVRHGRRNPGALKLRNLLQPDRFEEDLHLSQVLLQAPPKVKPLQAKPLPSVITDEERREQAAALRRFRLELGGRGAA